MCIGKFERKMLATFNVRHTHVAMHIIEYFVRKAAMRKLQRHKHQ